jgi:hypothetical protein
LMPIQAYKDLRGLHDWRTRTRWCGRPCGSGPQGLEPYLPLWPVGFGGHFIQVMALRHRNAGLRVVKMCFKELRRLMPSPHNSRSLYIVRQASGKSPENPSTYMSSWWNIIKSRDLRQEHTHPYGSKKKINKKTPPYSKRSLKA